MLLARYTNWNRPCSALWMRLRLQRVKMRNDAIDVKVNKGLLAFWTEEECAVGGVVHEEVFGEDGGADGMAEEVEVFLEVGIGFGRAGADVVDVGSEGAGFDAGMVFAVEFTQGFITTLQKVVEIEFTPKVTETIVQYFVAYLCVFIAGH